MRGMLGLAAAVLFSALAAYVLGEYELTLWTSLTAGAVIGAGVSEILASVGRRRGPVPAAVGALLAAGAVAWAGRIDSGYGLDPYPAEAWSGVALAALVAGARLLIPTARVRAPGSPPR